MPDAEQYGGCGQPHEVWSSRRREFSVHASCFEPCAKAHLRRFGRREALSVRKQNKRGRWPDPTFPTADPALNARRRSSFAPRARTVPISSAPRSGDQKANAPEEHRDVCPSVPLCSAAATNRPRDSRTKNHHHALPGVQPAKVKITLSTTYGQFRCGSCRIDSRCIYTNRAHNHVLA
jgi:hypothetical protein